MSFIELLNNWWKIFVNTFSGLNHFILTHLFFLILYNNRINCLFKTLWNFIFFGFWSVIQKASNFWTITFLSLINVKFYVLLILWQKQDWNITRKQLIVRKLVIKDYKFISYLNLHLISLFNLYLIYILISPTKKSTKFWNFKRIKHLKLVTIKLYKIMTHFDSKMEENYSI